MRYWIQRADFSSDDFEPVDLVGAERILRNHDWRTALGFMRALARSHGEESGEYCPPGIGFARDDGRLLHICPNENGTALCFYNLVAGFNDANRQGREKAEPTRTLWSNPGDGISLLHQYRALQLFYRGDFDGVILAVQGLI
jgi:hypothetical protein